MQEQEQEESARELEMERDSDSERYRVTDRGEREGGDRQTGRERE